MHNNPQHHTAASLYQLFPPPKRAASSNDLTALHAQARKLADMAESELAVLSTQCLDRLISDKTKSRSPKSAAWQKRRNTRHAEADWQFKTADPRVKLASLYPQFVYFRR